MAMIKPYLDTPRHRQSEELAFAAERHAREEPKKEAQEGFARAARLEEEVALLVGENEPKERTLLAISAVSLWLKAREWEEAARAGCFFLGRPQALTPDGRRDLAALVDRAWRTIELDAYFTDRNAYVGLEARLDGGAVRKGIAPASAVAERREVIVPMLFRVAEWRTQRKFRKAGPSSFVRDLEVIEAPALAASYTVRLFVGPATGQQPLPDIPGSPKDVVDSFLLLAAAVGDGAQAIQEIVQDQAYTKAFVRGFRDLAADGSIVGSVEISAPDSPARERVRLLPDTRIELSKALQTVDGARDLELVGVLKAISLRGEEPHVVVESEGKAAMRLRIAKGEQDDTIGPKLNRRVQIKGRHVVTEDGEPDDWADDVVLLEDEPRAVMHGTES